MTRPFVNRAEEIRRVRQVVKDDGQRTPVLVFTGIGGMGKTAIRIGFEEKTLKPHGVPYAALDYDGDPNLRSIDATLRTIRRQLSRYGIRTPVFDFLYARYFELHTGLKLSSSNFPAELADVVHILEGIPVVGNITQVMHGVTRLGLRVKQRLQQKEWLYRVRELEPKEVLNLLPEVLAEDLEEAAAHLPKRQDPVAFRMSLLFDAYERLSDSQVDDTLHRKLLLLTPHLLRIIFTRNPLAWERQFPKEWHGKIVMSPPLEVLSSEDAQTFLRQKNVDDPDLRDYLCKLTGGYPLHLELCADMTREIEEATASRPRIQDLKGTVQVADLTEGLIHRLLRQLKPDERDLVHLAAYPRWVSEEVLEVLSSVPESVARIFRKFAGLSMFTAHPELEGAYVLRKEVRSSLLSQQRRKRLWKKRHGLLSKFHEECWEETGSLLHLQEALYHGFHEDPEEARKLFEEHFWKFLEKYAFGEAEGLIEAVPAAVLTEKARRSVDYARARLLRATGSSRESMETAKQLYAGLVASETDEELLGQYCFSLGSLLDNLGEYRKALKHYEKSLAMRLKIDAEEHPDVAKCYFNMGLVYWRRGEYEKSLEYHNKSLAIRLKVYGEHHRDVGFSYNSMGCVYERIADYGKALEYHRKSLDIRLKVCGEEHPDVACSYNNIGNVYWYRAEYEEALKYYQKCLAIWMNVYGEEHPQAATSHNNIGQSYERIGEYGKALEHHQKSLAMRLQLYGEQHPDVAHSYSSMGIVFDEMGEYEKALEYHQKSLAIRLKVHGGEHPHVAACYTELSGVHLKMGEYGKTLEYNEKSLPIWLKAYGEEHPHVALSYNNMGGAYEGMDDYGKAREYHRKSLAIRLKVYGEEHPDVAESYRRLAQTLWVLKREEDALEKIRRGVDIYCKFNLWKAAIDGLDTLAGWLEQMGRRKEAEKTRAQAQRLREEHQPFWKTMLSLDAGISARWVWLPCLRGNQRCPSSITTKTFFE